jgi:uncharacterized protein
MISCNNCSACCGPVPITYKELQEIKQEWNRLPVKKRKEIKEQKRDSRTCILLDTKTQRCSVYKSRPLLCRMFGHYKGLQCKYHPDEPLESDAKGQERIRQNGLPIGILSINITYQHLEK